ncbi:MAG: hypothetical protein PVSMB1_12440 [Gemmatimonadaceae bacterium]
MVTITAKAAVGFCIQTLLPPAMLRVMVHQVPPGQYETVVNETVVSPDGHASTSELARGSITIP